MTPSLICGIGPLGFAMGTPQPEPAPTAAERTPEEARQWMDEQGLSQAELRALAKALAARGAHEQAAWCEARAAND